MAGLNNSYSTAGYGGAYTGGTYGVPGGYSTGVPGGYMPGTGGGAYGVAPNPGFDMTSIPGGAGIAQPVAPAYINPGATYYTPAVPTSSSLPININNSTVIIDNTAVSGF